MAQGSKVSNGKATERSDHKRAHHGDSSFTPFLWLWITVALKKEGFCVNHKRVYRLMREMNIHSIIRKKRRYFGRKASVVLPNRLNREFQTNQPNQLYVTDITYIACGQRFYYLSAVQDLYNNEVVAWKLSKRNDLELVMKTVESLTAQRDVQGAILHSDQGFQYTTKAYQKRLETVGLKGSHRLYRIIFLAPQNREYILFFMSN
ncbi:IS3 family transposase [Bacillus subtilis]|uniref:IS3 family transposase n=1 Tax=Bacillus subtilis TaxID=1423 RepID=UPI0022E328ED|nr:IS3 family transposase [Bacillus subtilis]